MTVLHSTAKAPVAPPSTSAERIYLSVPHMGDKEQIYVNEAFATNWLSSVGPNLDAFERDMAELLGHGVHTLAVTSGTAALHLILRYLGVGPGDRVAVSTMTFAGAVYPICYLGAQPVFIDCDESSANLDVGALEAHLRQASKTGDLPKVLVAVHLYGQHADIDPIAELCHAYGVTLVEDAAESLGATYKGRQTGVTADYALLSFNGNKIITTTGGGMVVAKSAEAVGRMKKWANQSREPAVEYLHRELGYNYRLSNVLAGIGRGQLEVLASRVAARRRVAERYRAAFAGIEGVDLLPEMPWGTHTRWLSVMRFDPVRLRITPNQIVDALGRLQIEARPVWRPMHTQPLFEGAPYSGGSGAETLFARGVCLPSSSSLTHQQQSRVVNGLLELFRVGNR